MVQSEREQMIRRYFDMWVMRDFEGLEDLFALDIYYSECYGPEYNGLAQIQKWITALLKKQNVLEWKIKQFIHQENIMAVEWFFKDITDGKESGFDGVSIVNFQEDKIISIKEFSSVAEHIYPFGE